MKIAVIGATSHMDQTSIELMMKQKLGDTVEVVFADTGTQDKTIHISELESVSYTITKRPEIPIIELESFEKEKRKGWQRPYKYHK